MQQTLRLHTKPPKRPPIDGVVIAFPSLRQRGISSGASQSVSAAVWHQLPPARAAAAQTGTPGPCKPPAPRGLHSPTADICCELRAGTRRVLALEGIIFTLRSFSVKKLRTEKSNNLFSLVTAEHASASGGVALQAQLVTCIILSYSREKRYFIPPSCSSLPHSTRDL